MPEKEQPLVSLITYSYNGERFIDAYFKALLAQTYTNIELFFYNNGSTDRTGERVESYRKALTDKGILVHMEHYKDNQVTCSLKQKAFMQMRGKYFCGVDSDDIMTPHHIRVMAEYLELHPDKSMVFGKLKSIREGTGEHIGIMQVQPKTGPKELFIDCLMSRNMIYTPIGCMMRTEAFNKANHGFEIYQTRYGENYQLLLPLLYEENIGFLDEVVGQYLVRGDSYTANLRDPQKKLTALDEQLITIRHTVEKMDIPDGEAYIKMAERRLCDDALCVSYLFKDRELARQRKQRLKACGGYNLMAALRYIRFLLKNR